MALKKTQLAPIWLPSENGYEVNSSSGIIITALELIKRKHRFVTLLHKGYQSGKTIIVNFDGTHLFLDKPLDWPEKFSKIRVVFKDEFQVWNHFTVQIIQSGKDTLKTTFPTELFRLQRRSHFRIHVPLGSKASFTQKELTCDGANLINMSVGGMMLSLEKEKNIFHKAIDSNINTIDITIFEGHHDDDRHKITVDKGTVVREVFDKDRNRLELGVQFSTAIVEEKNLLQYIRQRELELLRKGIKK